MSGAENFDFGAASSGGGGGGPTEADYYPATLRAIQKPKPAAMANDAGENPLTCVFEWELDDFPGDYRKWSFINVEARSEKSNFNKMHMACFGTPVPKGAFASSTLIGARCKLNIAEQEKDPTKLVVKGYVPLRRGLATPARPAVAGEFSVEAPTRPRPVTELMDDNCEDVPF